MKNLSPHLFEGFFSNIGNDRDVALKKAIQNFDLLIKDCVELLKDMFANPEDKNKPYYLYIKQQFSNSKQCERLIDTFKFLIENHEYSIIVSTESDGKRNIKPREYKAFREYSANKYNAITERPTITNYKTPRSAAEGFFPVLLAYALDIDTNDLGLSRGNFKIQDIYLVKV